MWLKYVRGEVREARNEEVIHDITRKKGGEDRFEEDPQKERENLHNVLLIK